MALSRSKRTAVIGSPQWIEATLHRTPGRDPLGLQTITLDRIIPTLVPGILALSRRARYLSFHTFLLDEYKRRKLAPTYQALSKFMLAREYEFALAVEMCPRCDSSPVGRDRSGPAAAEDRDAYARGESVQSPLGGYGLYYRTPLADLGIVVRSGTPLGDDSNLPIDVLLSDGRGEALAAAFRDAVANTSYYREHFTGRGRIPRDALVEYAKVACLCRLNTHVQERNLLREAILTPASDDFAREADQRTRSFALYLTATRRAPQAASRIRIFREQVWDLFASPNPVGAVQARITAQWAALILKEYMQESLSAMWIDLCKQGLRRQPPEGFDPAGLTAFLRQWLARARTIEVGRKKISCKPSMPTGEFLKLFVDATKRMSLEAVREWARHDDSALSGLALLLLVANRLPDVDTIPEEDRAFLDIGAQRSYRQEGLIQIAHAIDRHLTEDPNIADTVEWLVKRYVIEVHERVAYSKLPNFTFRFRWESGRLRFYNLGVEAFDLADMRWWAIGSLCEDLGYIAVDTATPKDSDIDLYTVTPAGRALIADAFA